MIGLPTREPLRVALLTRGSTLLTWQAQTLAAMEREKELSVVRIIMTTPATSLPSNAERMLCNIQEALEAVRSLRRSNDGNRQPLSDTRDVRKEFPRAVVECSITNQARQSLTDQQPMAQLDLIINCGVDDEALALPSSRLGVLACEFSGTPDDIGVLRALVQGEGRLTVEISLHTGGGKILLDSALPALPERPVLHETRDAVYRRAGALLTKAIRRLRSDTEPRTARASKQVPAPRIDAGSVCRYAMRRVIQSLRARWHSKTTNPAWADERNNWFLAYRTDSRNFICNTERFNARGFKLLLPPPGRCYADPCVLRFRGQEHIFLEEIFHDTDRGVISWTTLDADGVLLPPEVVLQQPYHLSYPFVFEAEGEIFMIPETAQARSIDLYRAVDFPRRWEKVKTLLENISAADATVIEHAGRWWMFTTVGEEGSSKCDQLHLYYADSIYGPWQPHRANPLKIDVSSARCAGRLFRRRGKLMRPSQDCSKTYGGAVTLNEVIELTPEAFMEIEVEKLLPSWLPFNTGFHTVSSSDNLEVIDGKMRSSGDQRFPGFSAERVESTPYVTRSSLASMP